MATFSSTQIVLRFHFLQLGLVKLAKNLIPLRAPKALTSSHNRANILRKQTKLHRKLEKQSMIAVCSEEVGEDVNYNDHDSCGSVERVTYSIFDEEGSARIKPCAKAI